MIALNLLDVKECMEKLLISDSFHSFSFIEGEITSFISYKLDGFIQYDFYDTGEKEQLLALGKTYVTWEEIKDHCFHLIKGTKVPLSFKFVMNFSPENTKLLIARNFPTMDIKEINGLHLRFQYENHKLTCITGVSMKTFSLDKSLELVWDDTAKKYLKQKGIVFEEL